MSEVTYHASFGQGQLTGGVWRCSKCGGTIPQGSSHSCPNQAGPYVNPTQWSWPPPMLRPPVMCPVCEGKTRVPNDFYPVGAGESALNAEFVQCRSCSGRGIV